MIEKELYGIASWHGNKGRKVSKYTLSTEGSSVTAVLCDYGARILDIKVRMPDGSVRSAVLGHPSLGVYEKAPGYLGALVGRTGNRTAGGRFSLDGKEYTLFRNDGNNSLHGGERGFDKKIYKARIRDSAEPSVTFSAVSPDGEEGYPGELRYSLKYTLCGNGLLLTYTAESDARTVINLTNHVYFNLAGGGHIGKHILCTDADRYLPTDRELIPTGELKPVAGTAFDFRTPRRFSSALRSGDPDIATAGGLDHCFVFPGDYTKARRMKRHISVVSPEGDLTLNVSTDRPGVQIYSGNFLGGRRYRMRDGSPEKRRGGFCLETEAFPDSANRREFTDIVLEPGRTYRSRTLYAFVTG